MKPTGPTKEGTRKLALLLEKHGKKKKQGIWLDLAERIRKPTRARAKVNLWKLGKLAGKFKGKVMVVPGKILGDGKIEGQFEVSAMDFSSSAIKKLDEKKCLHFTLNELVKKEAKPSEMAIVK